MVQFRPGGNLTLVAILCWPGFSDDSGVVFITFAFKNLVTLTLTSTNPNNRPAPKGEKCRIRGRFQHFSLTLLGVHWVMNICFWFFLWNKKCRIRGCFRHFSLTLLGVHWVMNICFFCFFFGSVESGVVFDTSHWSCWGYVGWWIFFDLFSGNEKCRIWVSFSTLFTFILLGVTLKNFVTVTANFRSDDSGSLFTLGVWWL